MRSENHLPGIPEVKLFIKIPFTVKSGSYLAQGHAVTKIFSPNFKTHSFTDMFGKKQPYICGHIFEA